MDYNLERLKRTEETLRQLGNEKCNICNYWVDKEYINPQKICNECEPKGV